VGRGGGRSTGGGAGRGKAWGRAFGQTLSGARVGGPPRWARRSCVIIHVMRDTCVHHRVVCSNMLMLLTFVGLRIRAVLHQALSKPCALLQTVRSPHRSCSYR